MDPGAGITVSLGTLGASCIGAFGGASYALAKSQSPSLMGFAAGINSGIAGLTFFALREYAISPALVLSLDTPEYTRRKLDLGIPSSRTLALSPTDELRMIRYNRLLDTALSGVITGGGLNYWRRGLRGIVPGGVTAGLACTLFQYAVNELSVQRIRYVANSSAATLSIPATSAPPIPAPTPTKSVNLRPIPEPPAPAIPLSEKIVNTISYVIPLTRLDDSEYLQRLERKRDTLDSKIDRLHSELSSNHTKRQ